ncbi:MAG: cytochrome c [Acidobacteriota bacterium]
MLLRRLALTSALIVVGVLVRGQAASRSVWAGVYTDEQAKRGEALYKTNCATCHLESLRGAESAPPLVGITFASSWEGAPLADLFERMRTSMPSDAPGSLSRQQNADVLAYMLHVAEFPSGPSALTGDTRALEQIRYDTYKPGP